MEYAHLVIYFVSLLFVMTYGIYLYKTEWTFGNDNLMVMCVVAVCPIVNTFGACVFGLFIISKCIIRLSESKK